MPKYSQQKFQEILNRLSNNDPTLTTIDLSDNQISDVGAKAIADALRENKSLTTIYLYTNKISDLGAKDIAEVLKTNKTLTTINLGYNQISAVGAKDIAEVLKTNTTLTEIRLGYNQISDEGAKDIADALRENKTLTTISLSSNQISAEILSEIDALIKRNNTMSAEERRAARVEKKRIAQEKAVQPALTVQTGDRKPTTQQTSQVTVATATLPEQKQPSQIQQQTSQNQQDQKALQELRAGLQEQQETVIRFGDALLELAQNQELLQQNQQNSSVVSSAIIDPKYHITAQDLAERNHIAADAKLSSYCDVVRENFNKAFFVATAISSGKISLEQGKTSKVLGMIDSLGSGIPIGASVFSAISFAVDKAGSTRRAGRYSNFSELVTSADPVETAAFVEKLACRMTITNEANIRNSSTQSHRNISNELNAFFREQVAQVSDAFAKGLFSERRTAEELLAHKNSKDAMEYVLTGRLGAEIEEQNKQIKKPSAAITPQEIKAKEQDQIITAIVEEVTGLKEKRLAVTSAVNLPTPPKNGSNVVTPPQAVNVSVSSSIAKAPAKKETLKDQLEAATAKRREEVEKQMKQAGGDSSEKKLDGLTRKDVEDIIKQVTGGLNLEMIEFLKRRFEEDLYRGKQTSQRAAGHQKNLVEEIVNILAGKESDGLVKPSEVLPARPDSNKANNSDSISDLSDSPSTTIANAKISELERRNAELEKKLEEQSHKQEEQNKKFAEFIAEQRRNQNQNNNGGCCTIS